MKTAIYTLDAFPDESHERESWFDRVGEPRIKDFAGRWGAEYQHIKIHNPEYVPANYHKLDVFKHFLESDRDRAIFMDMDIYIEDECPNLFEVAPDHGVAMTFDYLMPIMTNYANWIKDAHGPEAELKVRYKGNTEWSPTSNEQHFPENEGKKPWRYFNTGIIIFDREFAQLMVDKVIQYKLPGSNGEPERFPDGWGEQHEFNYQLDQAELPVYDMPREFNEMTGLTRNRGKYISHYAAPCGKVMMAQREIHRDQASFQRKYIKKGDGLVLNVGSNTDFSQLKNDFGAINIDLYDVDKVTAMRNEVDVIADARDLPEEYYGKCKTVVLGEIMEHFVEKKDRISALTEAKKSIKENGWITITFPQDDRDLLAQRQSDIIENKVEYAPGVPAYHAIVLQPEMVKEDLVDCGLDLLIEEDIHYPFGDERGNVKGKGFVAVTPEYRQRLRDNWDLVYNTD